MARLHRILILAGLGVGAWLLLRSECCCRCRESSDIVGNPVSMVFHRDGCRLYEPGKASPTFINADEAVGEGYRPCGVCKPA